MSEESDNINVVVFVQGDAKTDSVEIVVKPYTTFRELQYKMFKLVHIPMFLQKWVINDKIPESDKQFMADFNVVPWQCNTFFLIKDEIKMQDCSIEYRNNNSFPPEAKYEDLLKLSGRPLVCNNDCFECPICFSDTDPGDGIVLRSCLHSFCKDCLINTIKFCEEINVKCPFVNDDYNCESLLTEREIKGLLSPELWEKYLEKSVRIAQGNIENAYFCKTPNCKGWCIFEDDINEFACPVCNGKNCLSCRAIHPGYNCKQYQDIATGSDTETKAELARMVARGEAMYCPKCKIVIMKKTGCDYLQCSMCKTDICWVTRGPRWGPGGRGDTSGGCKCRVNGISCHPQCGNCH
ncbi:RBCK1 family protein [Megaselia abdita]